MARALLPEDLWSLIEAHIPIHHRLPKGGQPRIDDRASMTGILFVFKTGIPWEYLPRELGCGSGMTCWCRLHEWMRVGVWQRVHEVIRRRLREHDQIIGIRLALTLQACRHLPEASTRAETSRSRQTRKQTPFAGR
jgi:transposase